MAGDYRDASRLGRCELLLFAWLCGAPTAGMAAEAPPAVDGGHDQAAAAMQRGDYAVAFCAWRPLAASGDREAQYALGWMFHNGYGLAIDDRAAESWWQRAAEGGHTGALYSLGTLYSLGGKDVPRDFERAIRTWAEAAVAGHRDSQVALRQLAGRSIPEVERAALVLLTEQPEAFGIQEEVKVELANVRGGPGIDYRILTVIERGTPVVELVRHDDWVKIGLDDPPRIGWIYGPLIGLREQLAADSPP